MKIIKFLCFYKFAYPFLPSIAKEGFPIGSRTILNVPVLEQNAR